MYKYFDTHAHLYMEDYDGDREELIEKLKQEKIGVVVIGVDKKTCLEAIALSNQHENVFATIGYHPKDSKEDFDESQFIELIKNPKVVAVGECGLEFFRLGPDGEKEKEKQIDLFKQQIDFAVKYEKPLVIHCREAHAEVLEILKEKRALVGDKLRGVIHFFSGNMDVAKQYIELDFYFSFGGVLTFTQGYDEVVKFLPLERILPETDAPFVAPVPYRGKRNNSLYIKEIVEKIAEIKQIDLNKVKEALLKNTYSFFSINQ